jgi:hypothetical protein
MWSGITTKPCNLETAFVTMLEERCDEEFGVVRALEAAVSLEGQDRDRVCSAFGGLWPSKESIPQGLKPLSPAWLRGPSLKAWLT